MLLCEYKYIRIRLHIEEEAIPLFALTLNIYKLVLVIDLQYHLPQESLFECILNILCTLQVHSITKSDTIFPSFLFPAKKYSFLGRRSGQPIAFSNADLIFCFGGKQSRDGRRKFCGPIKAKKRTRNWRERRRKHAQKKGNPKTEKGSHKHTTQCSRV